MKNFLVTWAHITGFFLVLLGGLGLMVGDILLIDWAIDSNREALWWILPLNFLAFTGILSFLIWRECDW
jgi:hypothetical protein